MNETFKTDSASSRQRADRFGRLASRVTNAAGSSAGFLAAFVLVIVWAATGPFFAFSAAWQMVITTSTTLITFLMVFVIQHAQNRDTLAIQLKLNELISSNSAANNRLVDIEQLTAEELAVVKKFYVKLAVHTETATNVRASHSLDASQRLTR
jgi:low affinity Fe/Cu permease